jgi:hypothetical protein
MGLLNNTPAFESDDTTSAGEVFANAPQTSSSAAPAASQAEVAQTSVTATEIAVVKSSELAIAAPAYAISEGMKGAIKVDFNTFPQLITTNGNFVERESKAVLGDTIKFELLSFQDAWVVDPGDDKADKNLVRYSDDGVTCSDGTPTKEHLDFLRAGGFPLSSIKKRSVVVGEIISTSGKIRKFDGELVQFDLSPQSRVQWDRYLANSVNALRKGRKTEDELKLIEAVAELAVKGDNTYTKATFASVALTAAQ